MARHSDISYNPANDETSPGKVVSALDYIPVTQSVMIWGPPGVGKSESIKDYCKENDLTLYDVRLPLLDPIDLRGIGIPDTTNGTCKWLPPEFLPKKPKCLLFLDEITAAPPSLQAAAYQLTLDRKVGETSIPEDCRIVCAGNDEEHRGVAYRMPAPLANRMIHFRVKCDVASWRGWAYKKGIDPRIVSYITKNPSKLHELQEDSSGKAWPSPRSWAFADSILKSAKKAAPEIIGMMISGCVGPKTTNDFVQHCKSFLGYEASIDAIFKGRDNRPENNPGRATVLATSIICNAELDNSILKGIFGWTKSQNLEFQSMVLKGLEEKFGMTELEMYEAYRSYKKDRAGVNFQSMKTAPTRPSDAPPADF